MFASKQILFRMTSFMSLCVCCIVLFSERFRNSSVQRSYNGQTERLVDNSNVVTSHRTDRLFYNEAPTSSYLDYNLTHQIEILDASAGQPIHSSGMTKTCSALFAGDKKAINEAKRIDHQHR